MFIVLTGGLHNITAGTVDWLARPMFWLFWPEHLTQVRVESGLQRFLPRRIYSRFWLPATDSKHVVRIILNGIIRSTEPDVTTSRGQPPLVTSTSAHVSLSEIAVRHIGTIS